MKQKTNGPKWRTAFLILLACNLALILAITTRLLMRPTSEVTATRQATSEGDTKMMTLTTTRDQLNATVATFLAPYQADNLNYQLYATQTAIVFEGSYALLGTQIPLYVYFDPTQDQDGAITLEVKEVAAGTLALPAKDILVYIKKNYQLPDFITVNAKQKQIFIDLPHMENEYHIYVKSVALDLYNDNLNFEIYRKNS